MNPESLQPNQHLGDVRASARVYGGVVIAGSWTSTIGTGGVFELRRQELFASTSRKIFVVHGRDDGTKQAVTRYLEHLDLAPVLLEELPSEGRTLVEKVEANADVSYAVIILTPDDAGHLKIEPDQVRDRARQNVILELGYFLAKLGRRKVCALKIGDPELPSDYGGVAFIAIDEAGGWKLKLAAEIKASGIPIDLNRLL